VYKLVIALVVIVVNKSTDIVQHQLRMVGKSQTAGGGVDKELIAEAAEEVEDDFSHLILRHIVDSNFESGIVTPFNSINNYGYSYEKN